MLLILFNDDDLSPAPPAPTVFLTGQYQNTVSVSGVYDPRPSLTGQNQPDVNLTGSFS